MAQKKRKNNFDDSISRLNEIVDILEDRDTPLETSVELYKEGIALVIECAGKLNDTEKEISMLMKTAEGIFEKKDFL